MFAFVFVFVKEVKAISFPLGLVFGASNLCFIGIGKIAADKKKVESSTVFAFFFFAVVIVSCT